LRWIAQDEGSKRVHVRHLKEGMSRVEPIPLHLPIPELASHPRMTRAEVLVSDIDLLQLSAGVRVLQIESLDAPKTALEPVSEVPEDDASAS
jgi:exoribonuclease-2